MDGAATVDLRGIAKSFAGPAGPVRAVRGVDLAIAGGETVALLGPNGAGKSTTMDVLLGLATPDVGEARLFGGSPAAAIAAGRVGAMLQTGSLVPGVSVRELVAVVGALYPSPLPVDEALALAGVEAIAGRRTERLSGGETQRVRFALALVCDPDLLVLDEPTVAMDVESRRAFWASMRGLAARGRTILFATHYLEEADAYADRVVLMARGAIVADGPPGELKAGVGGRTIRATLPDVDPEALLALPGVTTAERRGETVVLACADADRALRAFLPTYPAARDIEVGGARFEEAFMELTGAEEGA